MKNNLLTKDTFSYNMTRKNKCIKCFDPYNYCYANKLSMSANGIFCRKICTLSQKIHTE